jgi:hypothetical protein
MHFNSTKYESLDIHEHMHIRYKAHDSTVKTGIIQKIYLDSEDHAEDDVFCVILDDENANVESHHLNSIIEVLGD